MNRHIRTPTARSRPMLHVFLPFLLLGWVWLPGVAVAEAPVRELHRLGRERVSVEESATGGRSRIQEQVRRSRAEEDRRAHHAGESAAQRAGLRDILLLKLREPRLEGAQPTRDPLPYLRRAKWFLAAGDYRRALDACLFEVWDRPSVESYVYLTYVYHAINGYLDHLAKEDRWLEVGHLFLNLAARGAEDLINPPDALTRIAKEIIHGAVLERSDITAAMANRLDREAVDRLWKQQTAWRAARPDDWWFGVPETWNW